MVDLPIEPIIDAAFRHTYGRGSYSGIVTAGVFTWGLVKYYKLHGKLANYDYRLGRVEEITSKVMSFPLPEKSISGYRFGKNTWYSSFHLGVDYKAAKGTELRAPFSGTIIWQGKGFQGGNTIHFKPDHDDVVMRFMHLDSFESSAHPRHVNQGDLIARTGNTGFLTTGPHCHIDISRHSLDVGNTGNFIDPETYDWNWSKPETVTVVVPVETPHNEVPQVGTSDFVIVVDNKRRSTSYFRNEPTTESGVFAEYSNGTEVWCDSVVTGQNVNGSNQWFRSRKNKKFISTTVARRK